MTCEECSHQTPYTNEHHNDGHNRGTHFGDGLNGTGDVGEETIEAAEPEKPSEKSKKHLPILKKTQFLPGVGGCYIVHGGQPYKHGGTC